MKARYAVLLLTLASCTILRVEESPELAPYMASLQRYSQKLGYSIYARNKPLAEFYLDEIGETLEAIEHEVPEFEGLPIAVLSEQTLGEQTNQLRQALQKEDWLTIGSSYRSLISSCNACHAATKHHFIEILPASGEPPFNQKF